KINTVGINEMESPTGGQTYAKVPLDYTFKFDKSVLTAGNVKATVAINNPLYMIPGKLILCLYNNNNFVQMVALLKLMI
ncbi:MAG: hypothetical protein RR627_00570, partial [Niameybacter sp.]